MWNKTTADNLFKKFNMEAKVDDEQPPQEDEEKESKMSARRSQETAIRSRSHGPVEIKFDLKRAPHSWHEGDFKCVLEESESAWENTDVSWQQEYDAWLAESGEKNDHEELEENIEDCFEDPPNEDETQTQPQPKRSLTFNMVPKIISTSSDPEMFANANVKCNPALTSMPPMASASTSAGGDYYHQYNQPRPSIFQRHCKLRGLAGAIPKILALHKEPSEMKTIEDSLLYEKLKNLFLCMRITGIFFVRQERTSIGSRTR